MRQTTTNIAAYQGVLAPLLVRELEEASTKWVAGARRLRAAKLTDLDNLPVRG